jgi:hypothetical protein
VHFLFACSSFPGKLVRAVGMTPGLFTITNGVLNVTGVLSACYVSVMVLFDKEMLL